MHGWIECNLKLLVEPFWGDNSVFVDQLRYGEMAFSTKILFKPCHKNKANIKTNVFSTLI